MERLKLADSDALGVGRDLIAFHPQAWKKVNRGRDYKQTAFDVAASFEITSRGIKIKRKRAAAPSCSREGAAALLQLSVLVIAAP
ncbi:hypothetical protein GT019_09095 [Paenibacillus sp. T1]|uniref:Uncharacterized protein n=1 Tax=Paenibacillus glycinis TaxID=2697035 RepID=A0ABW9XNR2_9BACL|nr:hypothetical protein [Paenibacillus glycinis]